MASFTGSERKPLPATVLSGFLGAGKSTLLHHILTNKTGLRVAVIVNDMAEANIDAKQAAAVVSADEQLVEMSNGCICCTLREDLLKQITELARADPPFDYLLIESTGISEPLPVAQTFSFEVSDCTSLRQLARLDCLVTVVDSAMLASVLGSIETLQEAGQAAGPKDQRNLCSLMIDQLEWANVILLNKMDLLPEEEARAQVEALVRKLNPSARLLRCERSSVPLDSVLGTGLFDMDEAQQSAGWAKELATPHSPETEEYGVSSVVFRARRPFHPARLHSILRGFGEFDMLHHPEAAEGEWDKDKPFHGVIRSKGEIWLATTHSHRLEWQSFGGFVNLDPRNPFLAALPTAAWDNDKVPEAMREKIRSQMEGPHGDRCTELVLIGVNMDKAKVTSALNEALVTEEEMETFPEGWLAMEDPLFGEDGKRDFFHVPQELVDQIMRIRDEYPAVPAVELEELNGEEDGEEG